jgi:hypothetical protein
VLAGASESGCPRRARTMTLRYRARAQAFMGKLRSSESRCVTAQEVKIFRQRAGTDPEVGTMTTGASGTYTLDGPARKGVYYSVVARSVLEDIAECDPAESARFRVG